MSKTYRKFISFTDNQRGGARYGKRKANKIVRHFDGDIPKGYAYIRKMFCSYDIHDYRHTYYNKNEIRYYLQDYEDSRWINPKTIHRMKRAKCNYGTRLFKRTSIKKSYTN